uniref:Aquaporin n=1 Tax=Eutreptiella gymnastica TaxID=73025 RepID=A0A7S1JG67_9EUGL
MDAHLAEPAPSSPSRTRKTQAEKKMFLVRVCLAECLCTFIFLFSVMAMSINLMKLGQSHNTVESAIVTGFVAIAIIYAFGDVSGAHFNPAVTFGTMVVRKTSLKKGLCYIVMQLLASVGATLWIGVLYGVEYIGELVLVPHDEILRSLLMEFTLTFILVFVIMSTAFASKESIEHQVGEDGNGGHKGYSTIVINSSGKAQFAGIAIGFTLGYLTMIGGSVSGGAFNPARAFGPSLVTLRIFTRPVQWLYWLGDFAGAAGAAIVHHLLEVMFRFENERPTLEGVLLALLPGRCCGNH